jgi:hypothetical protein
LVTAPGCPLIAWHEYLFIGHRGHDLLTFNLASGRTVGYERNCMRHDVEPICTACNDGNAISHLQIDSDRMFVIGLSGAKALVVDLPSYVASLGSRDLLADPQPQ